MEKMFLRVIFGWLKDSPLCESCQRWQTCWFSQRGPSNLPNGAHLLTATSLPFRRWINVIVKHRCLEAAPAPHRNSPISMCYVTAEASAPINTAISEISLTEELGSFFFFFHHDKHKSQKWNQQSLLIPSGVVNEYLLGSRTHEGMEACRRCIRRHLHVQRCWDEGVRRTIATLPGYLNLAPAPCWNRSLPGWKWGQAGVHTRAQTLLSSPPPLILFHQHHVLHMLTSASRSAP